MRIAIIGSGISGLTAAYLLSQQYTVDVFEKESWIGGHTHTLAVKEPHRNLAIDTGFIVFNDKTYPNFNALIAKLGVARQKTTMSFSVRNSSIGLEYNGTNISGLFADRSNWVNRDFLTMLFAISRINKLGKQLTQIDSHITLREFIVKHRLSSYVVDNYLIPMCCAIWSCAKDKMLETPAKFLFEFLHNHGMLNIQNRPTWYVIRSGSRSYVDILIQEKNINIISNNPVLQVSRTKNTVVLSTQKGQMTYDKVIFATHASDTLNILVDPSHDERYILSHFPYQPNSVILHTDTAVLPTNKRAWAAWNYIVEKNHTVR